MGEWKVELKGENFDLSELLEGFNSTECAVSKKDSKYYLKSDIFQELSDARQVLESAKEMVSRINGISRLEFQNWKNVCVSGVSYLKDDGTENVFLSPDPIVCCARVRVSDQLTIIRNAKVISEEPSIPRPQRLIELCSKDHVASKALRLYGLDDQSWVNLYRIFEIIEDDIGSNMVERGWVSSKKATKFTRTANSPSVIGDDARHGSEKYTPPSKPMTLQDGKEFISGLLNNWLNYKLHITLLVAT